MLKIKLSTAKRVKDVIYLKIFVKNVQLDSFFSLSQLKPSDLFQFSGSRPEASQRLDNKGKREISNSLFQNI